MSTSGNNDFDTTIINVRERPLSSDINQISCQEYQTIRDMIATMYAIPSTGGFIGQSFRVEAASGSTMNVTVGFGDDFGFQVNPADVPTNINGALQLNDLSIYKPMCLSAVEDIAVPAADATNPRIDIVEVQYSRQLGNPQSRGILNQVTGVFDATLVDKTMSFNLNGTSTVNGTGPINYKTGTPGATPTEPIVDAGYTKIGAIYVPANATGIYAPNVGDRRALLAPDGICTIHGHARLDLSTETWDVANIQAPPGVSVALEYNQNFPIGTIFYLNFFVTGPFPLAGSGALPSATVMLGQTDNSGNTYNIGVPALWYPEAPTGALVVPAFKAGTFGHYAHIQTTVPAISTGVGVKKYTWSMVGRIGYFDTPVFVAGFDSSASKLEVEFIITVPISVPQ